MPSIMDVSEDWIVVLERVTQRAKDTSENFDKRRLDTVREKALDYCLNRGLDICQACILSAKAGLTESLWVLDRSLFESLLWARWVSLSDKNAEEYAAMGKNEYKRMVKKNLEAGTVNIVSKSSGANHSQDVLNKLRLENMPKRKMFEKIAVEAGFASVYTTTYGISSLHSHGEAFGVDNPDTTITANNASVAMAIGFIQCIELIAKDWILANQISSQDIIDRIIGTSDNRAAAKSAVATETPGSASPTVPRRHRRKHGHPRK
jgi:Family of unknown function (DUF5677)